MIASSLAKSSPSRRSWRNFASKHKTSSEVSTSLKFGRRRVFLPLLPWRRGGCFVRVGNSSARDSRVLPHLIARFGNPARGGHVYRIAPENTPSSRPISQREIGRELISALNRRDSINMATPNGVPEFRDLRRLLRFAKAR